MMMKKIQEEIEDYHGRIPELVDHYVSPNALGEAIEPEECIMSNNRHTSQFYNPNKPEKWNFKVLC